MLVCVVCATRTDMRLDSRYVADGSPLLCFGHMDETQPHQGIAPADTQATSGIDALPDAETLINVPAHEQVQALIPEHARVRKLSELDDGELENRRSLAQVEMMYGQADIAKDPSTYRRWCKKNEWPNTVPLPVIKVDMGDGGSPLWLVHIGAIKERAVELSRRGAHRKKISAVGRCHLAAGGGIRRELSMLEKELRVFGRSVTC